VRAHLLAVLGVATWLGAAGCAGPRIVDGVFLSPKGYRVTLPAGAWEVMDPGGADLALRNGQLPATLVVHATCDPAVARRSPDVLLRHVVVGLAQRHAVTRASTQVAGRPALRAVFDGRAARDGAPVRVEAVMVEGEPCVYDQVYAASPGVFATGSADFDRLVGSLSIR